MLPPRPIDLEQLVENAKRDGVRVREVPQGSQAAGFLRRVKDDVQASQAFRAGKDKNGQPIQVQVPVRYDVVVNSSLGAEAKSATLAHELAHLYCGHLGTLNPRWWPDRRGLDTAVCEFEAESVSYLVCGRLGLDTYSTSAQYLNGYLAKPDKAPDISLDCVCLKTAGMIETMGRERLPERKLQKAN